MELARAHVPGGVLIDLPPWELDARVAATARAIADDADILYEASYLGVHHRRRPMPRVP